LARFAVALSRAQRHAGVFGCNTRIAVEHARAGRRDEVPVWTVWRHRPVATLHQHDAAAVARRLPGALQCESAAGDLQESHAALAANAPLAGGQARPRQEPNALPHVAIIAPGCVQSTRDLPDGVRTESRQTTARGLVDGAPGCLPQPAAAPADDDLTAANSHPAAARQPRTAREL
jgi:hypothetical protein